LFTIATTADEAVERIEGFYRVYHSLRFDNGLTVLRLQRTVSEKTLQSINRKFRDLLTGGEVQPSLPTRNELQNNEFPTLPRLALHFDMRSFDRLHELINVLNRD
jgi:hypothetical protein